MIRVLLADDEAMIRSALAALLRLEDDIEVIAECEDGEQAVAEALRLQPDVCLLDLEMPGLDGVQVSERLNRAIATRCIVVTRVRGPGCCVALWRQGSPASCPSPAVPTRWPR